ncbi:ORF74 [Ranid herpesvirus 1]|uniref:ORF74 n=1 Tax=Ranid herpesvirus 1 TaxID=85655 RepID=Q9YQZ4_9VIRU|nr:ORF74 [Ranid herpesvirus 1]AAD12271.1 ORF74 [Ranid herpesvirus 1]
MCGDSQHLLHFAGGLEPDITGDEDGVYVYRTTLKLPPTLDAAVLIRRLSLAVAGEGVFYVTRKDKPVVPNLVHLTAGIVVPQHLQLRLGGPQEELSHTLPVQHAHGITNGKRDAGVQELADVVEAVRLGNSFMYGAVAPLQALTRLAIQGEITSRCNCVECGPCGPQYQCRAHTEDILALNIFHHGDLSYLQPADAVKALVKKPATPEHIGMGAVVATMIHPGLRHMYEHMCNDTVAHVNAYAATGAYQLRGQVISYAPLITRVGGVPTAAPLNIFNPYGTPIAAAAAAVQHVPARYDWILTKRALCKAVNTLKRIAQNRRCIFYGYEAELQIVLLCTTPLRDTFYNCAVDLRVFTSRRTFALQKEIEDLYAGAQPTRKPEDLMAFPRHEKDDADVMCL